MRLKGIYISREQLQALAEWAERARVEAAAQLAQARNGLDAYYIHQAAQAPRAGNVIDITEHLRKRNESH
jgi:Holliday junction resolvase